MFTLKVRRSGEIRYLAFHPEGRLLFVNGQLWDLTSRKMLRELADFSSWSSRAFFTDDGQRLILSQYGRGVLLGQTENEGLEVLVSSISDAQASKGPNNTLIVSRGGYNQSSFVAAWSLAETKPELLWQTPETEFGPYTPHIALAPDGQTFAAAEIRYQPYRNQRLVINSMETGKMVRLVTSMSGWSHHVALRFHPSGEQLLLISEKTIQVYAVQDGKLLRTIQKPRGGTFQSFVMHPNNKFFLSVHRLDGIVNIWNADTLEIINSFKWPIRKGSALAISPDGLTCAVGDSQGNIVVWDWED